MSLLLANRGVIGSLDEDKVLITMNMSTPTQAGIYLQFSGSVDIDWKEGGGKVPFTTEVELKHTYTTPGTYIAEITGDLDTITKIRADNNKITLIEYFELITSTILDTRFNNNLLTGTLDLSLNSLSGLLLLGVNSGLNTLTLASSGNGMLTAFTGNNCSFTSLDFTNTPVSGAFTAHSMAGFNSLTFATSGNGLLTLVSITSTGLTSLPFTNVPVSGAITCHSNASMTAANFKTSGNSLVTTFYGFSTPFTSLDFTNVPIGGDFRIYGNLSLTSLTFAGAGNGALTKFYAYGTNISNVDFSVFPTSDGVDIQVNGCSYTATEHDNQLINLDATGWINGSLIIIAGNTARTAASNAAHANLLLNGWSIT